MPIKTFDQSISVAPIKPIRLTIKCLGAEN